ncbi:MAG: tRNA (N(6)-L-threonylcarbamoyladenosine(37)-C(2))-methylthiotransferase MtaB [Alphaproteobacteria bacterium]|jgi:threonylcarbamoyladenosine tRNA methylthiotransferase MtaB|nr:tRNA (N(6)-L-threonylcarbamoyladenosine(37)-C(2))-methylthiotransferase MtaB [Alphaproteobacteria bacterium]MBT5389674.1 tRNA (N(6)-L-threonylcarbamoyladenosine(37)-C(2))-methylthiotransferase MtaB [Alphaproteobacteria bacterium]MBT5541036.1 tRNA (N(6)-L-threonylcarbamoyladenosine(37)-C(2))-methylthiotransferase MtaB [Alphaproteobacteria bacterium]MBT5653971.1 tRNA (N(6)-L-threonylcarbamoyladenosine(37)-C(2))-methylthiotransferase MtaB [Alphaproteobacteria bacterium]
MKEAIDIVTFGCRLNTYESEVMRRLSKEAGLRNAVIFNTCAVTQEAERQARQAIRKIRREQPDTEIIVTGCAAQINPELYASMAEVDRVIGNDEKLKANSFTAHPHEKIMVNDIMSVKETASHMVSGFEGKARAFVQIQNGCDHRCTFCTIPFGRGNSRSQPIGAITQQTKELVQNGYNEIVLTGVDITAYGADLPGQPTLGQMIRRLFVQVPDLKRLRLSSLDPVEIDEDLYKLIENESRLMPHFHLSLQSGDTMILKRMKRRHVREDIIACCDKIRSLRSDAVFGADIIAGFPTESDKMFENTRALVEKQRLIHLHVFPYSERPGTPAARMPAVPKETRKKRATTLRQLGQQTLQDYLKTLVGQEISILIESENKGRSEQYASVILDEKTLPGSIQTAYIHGTENGILKGTLRG